MQEFITLQKYISEKLKIEVGRFIFSLDFGYIFKKDKEEVFEVLKYI